LVAPQPHFALNDRGHVAFLALSVFAALDLLALGLGCLSRWLGDDHRRVTEELLAQTDVTAGEVVLGGFLAGVVHGVGSVLPVAPLCVLAATLGGTSVLTPWPMVLALAVALILFQAVGTLGAAILAGERRMVTATVLLMLGLALWLPLTGLACERLDPLKPLGRWLLAASPVHALWSASEAGVDPPFFHDLMLQLLVSAIALRTASYCFDRRVRRGYRAATSGRRAEACLSRGWPQSAVWLVAALPPITLIPTTRALASGDPRLLILSLGCLFTAHLTIKALQAVAAVFSLREERQRGDLMFQLAATTSVEMVVDRHVVAMRREFRWPALSAAITNLATAALVLSAGGSVVGSSGQGIILALLVVAAVQVVTDARAIAWSGMRSGMTSEFAWKALRRTLGGIILIPWAGLWLLSTVNWGNFITSNEIVAYALCWLALGTGVSYILGSVARHRLIEELRSEDWRRK